MYTYVHIERLKKKPVFHLANDFRSVWIIFNKTYKIKQTRTFYTHRTKKQYFVSDIFHNSNDVSITTLCCVIMRRPVQVLL